MGFDSIYLWKDPLVTGPIFGSLLSVLISICYYSLISVVAYTSLFVLMTVAGIKLYVYVMNTFLKKNVPDPIQKYAGELPKSFEYITQIRSVFCRLTRNPGKNINIVYCEVLLLLILPLTSPGLN